PAAARGGAAARDRPASRGHGGERVPEGLPHRGATAPTRDGARGQAQVAGRGRSGRRRDRAAPRQRRRWGGKDARRWGGAGRDSVRKIDRARGNLMGRVIGIDLGTTNSCVALMDSDTAVVIPNREGARTTPSVVAMTDSGERLVGQIAK